jgi:hypothetical protein
LKDISQSRPYDSTAQSQRFSFTREEQNACRSRSVISFNAALLNWPCFIR